MPSDIVLLNSTVLDYSENVLALFQALELDPTVLDTNPDPFQCLCEALEKKYKKEGGSSGADKEDEEMPSAE
ncbi:hypothetical protein FOL47_008599 [Perkinsus chesapeaki]|uniref:Uncharacterized protein n=1 Tax=Perkinsus chesapeaki TaxID=330153 RepID=A0A7J6MVC0_PERCH|nr:hypothetical protein FOL47_008599 [Perkinsus chesapeaki]